MTSAVLFDLDSTIRDTRSRRGLCPTVNSESTWDRYHAAGWADLPLRGGIRLAHMLQAIAPIHIATFAPESNRVSTQDWLHRNHIVPHSLTMHDGSFGDDSVAFHVNCVGALLALGHTIDLVVQDQPRIAVAIENEHHIPVLCVNPCYAELPPLAGTL